MPRTRLGCCRCLAADGVHVVVHRFETVAIEAVIERETTDGYTVHGRRAPVSDTLCAALAAS